MSYYAWRTRLCTQPKTEAETKSRSISQCLGNYCSALEKSFRKQPGKIFARLAIFAIAKVGESGAPGQIRTGDILLRRQMLYPTELRAHRYWILPLTGFSATDVSGAVGKRRPYSVNFSTACCLSPIVGVEVALGSFQGNVAEDALNGAENHCLQSFVSKNST